MGSFGSFFYLVADKRFGILGHPVAHSLSPRLHGAVFAALDLKDWSYDFCDTSPEDLEALMKAFRAGDWAGFSVTIPHKKAVMAFCEELSQRAQRVGAVNTLLRREDGSIFGENTDYEGFKRALEEKNADCSGKDALVLGSGGAARAIIATLADLGAQVVVASRRPEACAELIQDFGVEVQSYDDLDSAQDWALIVNTTPLGMEHQGAETEKQSPLEEADWFRADVLYVDVVYTPRITPFLQKALDAGAEVLTGDRMFFWQAVEQSVLFTGGDAAQIQAIVEGVLA